MQGQTDLSEIRFKSFYAQFQGYFIVSLGGSGTWIKGSDASTHTFQQTLTNPDIEWYVKKHICEHYLDFFKKQA